MGSFLRSGKVRPVEPVMNLYELDCREPAVTIDAMGDPWIQRQAGKLPRILFGDVPTIIHTTFGFSIAPMSQANSDTGPEPNEWRKKIYGICIDEDRDAYGEYVVIGNVFSPPIENKK